MNFYHRSRKNELHSEMKGLMTMKKEKETIRYGKTREESHHNLSQLLQEVEMEEITLVLINYHTILASKSSLLNQMLSHCVIHQMAIKLSRIFTDAAHSSKRFIIR